VRLPAAEHIAARITSTGSPRRADRHAAELAAGSDPAATTALFFGCTVQSTSPDIGRAARKVFAAAAEPVRCAEDEACCGAVAADLGLDDEARARASRCADQLLGAHRVVALSPGCARMMRDEWPRLGLTSPTVVTSVEWLDEALADGRLSTKTTASPQSVAWHDPCTLARLLGVVDAPRRVLRALGVDVVEPAASGLHTRCSGGGQAFPLIDPMAARAVAAVRQAELAAAGVPVVSACPQAELMLGTPAWPARDILELAAERLVPADH
jgi:Fe-S oxidoreductase